MIPTKNFTTCDFLNHAVPKEWPPSLGEIFETSLLAWSFEEESFWRGKGGVAMAEVVSYAKSMALTRYREESVAGPVM